MEQPALVVTETEDLAKKDQTPLWQLAEAGDLDRVKIALNNGAQVNEVGPGGSTPLMLAVGGRHNAVAWIFLLHPELDPNLQDDHGFTALHIACGRDNPWAVARIGRHPAIDSINAVDKEGCTALMEAAAFGHTEGYPETLQALKAVKQERAPFQRSISEAPRQMNEKQNTGAHEI